MTDTQAGLLPCPFCGGKAEFRSMASAQIVCTICGADGPIFSVAVRAIAAWNTRPSTPASAEVDALIDRMYDEYSAHHDPADCKKVWREWLQASGAAVQVPDDMVLISREMLDFLWGVGSLDGVQFGGLHPTERGAFWWRKHLPDAPQKQEA